MSTSNAFMASAKKSKRAQADIEKPAAAADEEMVLTNVRLPKYLHRKAQFHRIETGETMTALIRRLVEDELEQDAVVGDA